MDNIKQEIEILYQKFLGRRPDDNGLESFLKRYKQGITL